MIIRSISNCCSKLSGVKHADKFLGMAALAAILSCPLIVAAAQPETVPPPETEPPQIAQPVSGQSSTEMNRNQPLTAQPSLTSPDTTGGDSIYSFKASALSGEEIDLAKYKGQVLLVVNTASHCGFTPQYAGLETLYEKYGPQGLSILGFPCNQFAGQEKGTAEEISTFCQKNYGVTFQMFAKIDVNGKDEHPLYTFLKREAPNDKSGIKWNFTKFLIGRDGKVFRRYGSMAKPESLTEDIEKLLAKPANGA